ncbi:hypothetical protein KP509_21G021500 [Ceratopteris richardii]|uniref:Uncharacterized protein n=1 Tax=Ceratopteris richardii TaxID=49495 RepID=A0A8T2S827_CERRI|nr:hypothetical protein KP509_21G021500 [Ceratopteris richardii]
MCYNDATVKKHGLFEDDDCINICRAFNPTQFEETYLTIIANKFWPRIFVVSYLEFETYYTKYILLNKGVCA